MVTLLDKGVIVGLGIQSAWQAQTTRFDVQWVRTVQPLIFILS